MRLDVDKIAKFLFYRDLKGVRGAHWTLAEPTVRDFYRNIARRTIVEVGR